MPVTDVHYTCWTFIAHVGFTVVGYYVDFPVVFTVHGLVRLRQFYTDTLRVYLLPRCPHV